MERRLKKPKEHIRSRISEREIQDALVSRHSAGIQEKLKKARVAVAGLGGLGSNVAVWLARTGTGHLHLVDFDRVDLTNLNRQHYFLKHLGMYKTDALKEQILEINPYLDIRTDCVKVTQDNIKMLFSGEDIICEAFDLPEEKAMFVNGVLLAMPEKKLVSASGMAGFGHSNRIHTRKIRDNFYLCGDEETKNGPKQGLMAPRAALCAAHEANLVIQLIMEETD